MTEVSVLDAKETFDAVRYLWRGTRWNSSSPRWIPEATAGHFFTGDGIPRPFGETVTRVTAAFDRADLDSIQRLVVGEYYGLLAYPSDLAGGANPLVGRVRSATGRQSQIASRSLVELARKSGISAIANAIERAPLESRQQLEPINDPMLDSYLLERLGMSSEWDKTVLESCYYAAHDLTDRAANARGIQLSLELWAERHFGRERIASTEKPSYASQRSAFAALHIALWNMVDTASETREDQRLMLWPSVAIHKPRSALVIDTERWGVIDQADASAADLVCLCSLVIDGEDLDGTVADFVLPILVHRDAGPALTSPTYALLVWGVAYQLASRGDWRAVEMAVALVDSNLDTFDRLRLTTWAAHVASSFGHDALAWRMVNHADRMIRLHPGEHTVPFRRMILQVRSGIAIRTSDRSLTSQPAVGLRELRRAFAYVTEARLAGNRAISEGTTSDLGITEDLRLLEVLLVAFRYHVAGHDIAEVGPIDLTSIRKGVGNMRQMISVEIDADDDDYTIVMKRIIRLEGAISIAELDDSALGLFLSVDI